MSGPEVIGPLVADSMLHLVKLVQWEVYPGITAATRQDDANPPHVSSRAPRFVPIASASAPTASRRPPPDPRPASRRARRSCRHQLHVVYLDRAGPAAQASPETLARWRRRWLLSRAERAYLFHLAARWTPTLPDDVWRTPPRRRSRWSTVGPARLRARPPVERGCWNAAAADLFRGWLDAGAETSATCCAMYSYTLRALGSSPSGIAGAPPAGRVSRGL